jgi:hypothetical protein
LFIPDTKDLLFNVNIEYARKGRHMYLNYITFNNAFVVSEDYILREDEVIFNNEEQAFHILFNNTKDFLDWKTIDKYCFKFKFGNRNLKTVDVKKETDRRVKVLIKPFDDDYLNITEENIKDLSYTFKRIRDVKGRLIYQAQKVEGDQFREFFVQRVNQNKPAPNDLIFMDQNALVNEAILNLSPNANQYWVNSPLIDKKYRDKADK